MGIGGYYFAFVFGGLPCELSGCLCLSCLLAS